MVGATCIAFLSGNFVWLLWFEHMRACVRVGNPTSLLQERQGRGVYLYLALNWRRADHPSTCHDLQPQSESLCMLLQTPIDVI